MANAFGPSKEALAYLADVTKHLSQSETLDAALRSVPGGIPYALAVAYDAGRKDSHKVMKNVIEVLTGPALILDKGSAQSSADKAYRILYKEVYGE